MNVPDFFLCRITVKKIVEKNLYFVFTFSVFVL